MYLARHERLTQVRFLLRALLVQQPFFIHFRPFGIGGYLIQILGAQPASHVVSSFL